MAIVTTGNYPGIVRAAEVVLERGEIEVFMDSISRVQGTRLNDLYALYHKRNKQFRDSINSRDQHGNFKLDKVLIKEKFEAHDKYLVDFYKQNIENPVGRRAFKNYSNNLMGNDVYEIYALLPEQYKSDPEIVNATRIRRELDKRNSARQALVGKKYSDFDLLTPDQTAKKLSDYIGKSEFVLLSFWGSFCGPCIDKMPELKDVYEKYHDKGFEIISISMDNSLGMWRGGINKVDVPWIHLSDLKGDKSPLKEAYHILGVPYEILLDKEGTIIQVHVNGAFLHKFLHKELD